MSRITLNLKKSRTRNVVINIDTDGPNHALHFRAIPMRQSGPQDSQPEGGIVSIPQPPPSLQEKDIGRTSMYGFHGQRPSTASSDMTDMSIGKGKGRWTPESDGRQDTPLPDALNYYDVMGEVENGIQVESRSRPGCRYPLLRYDTQLDFVAHNQAH
jgi:hypothetical protein